MNNLINSNKMKQILFLTVTTVFLFSGCSLLETENDDEYSGDKFWSQGNRENVEAFTLSVYNYFRKATVVQCAFVTATGDFRCAPITGNGAYFSRLINNDMGYLATNYTTQSGWRFEDMTRWAIFYQVVQSANILIEEVGRVPGLTADEVAMYKTEGVFMRNLAYFFMARAWGDVPYYTNAYNAESLPRTGMVTVMQNCLADLKSVIDSDPDALILPWVQQSASKSVIRASRGSYYALMMHLNLWLAHFNAANATAYYEETARLGEEIVHNNEETYELLPALQYSTVFAGGSRESIFEVVQDVGMNEVFIDYANYSDVVCFTARGTTSSLVYYDYDFIEQIFPKVEEDKRKNMWFSEAYYDETVTTGTGKEVLKFVNPATTESNRELSNSGNYIVFRFADVILLYAEALAELGTNDSKACDLLNMIRNRAGAAEVNVSGSELQDAVFWERVRELIGEGHYYYDLVRTGKICNMNYCKHYITRTQFNAGAWTLPVHAEALEQNTKMTLNNFWVN
jgi:hypothetical protein